MTQQAVMYNMPAPDAWFEPPMEERGESNGVDLHFRSVGHHSLALGDTLLLPLQHDRAAYERIVEWIVPDTRDAYGRQVSRHEREADPERYRDAAWDAIRFENPFDHPMTTAPAMIVDGGRFQGQRLSPWVNPGEMTTLHITKALSVRTKTTEREEPGEREIVFIAGDDYRRTTVRGELEVVNHRSAPATLVIRRRFSGELIESDGEPDVDLREEGVYSVNPRHQMTWTIELAPGEERTLEYRYRVLVNM
jgi:hypothetical protein